MKEIKAAQREREKVSNLIRQDLHLALKNKHEAEYALEQVFELMSEYRFLAGLRRKNRIEERALYESR